MSTESDNDPTRTERKALQRLATLQRMREEAKKGNRAAMLDSLDKLIELERRILREASAQGGEHSS